MLRQLLAERFPQAARAVGGVLATGVPAVDEAAGGGLPRPALSELIVAGPSAGGSLFLAQLLATTRLLPARVALVDAADSFDPQSFPPEELQHLLWVRCPTPAAAMPVVDLLAREASLDAVVLDLARVLPSALRKIPAAHWYRLQRAVEQTDLALLVLTPIALVPCAALRLTLEPSHRLDAQSRPRPALGMILPVVLARQRSRAALG